MKWGERRRSIRCPMCGQVDEVPKGRPVCRNDECLVQFKRRAKADAAGREFQKLVTQIGYQQTPPTGETRDEPDDGRGENGGRPGGAE